MSDTPVEAFLHLLHETESFYSSDDSPAGKELASFLKLFRDKRVLPLYKQQKKAEAARYMVSFVGLTNVGKSTLTAALIGHDVAPRRNGPGTAVPVEYIYGETWSIKFHSYNDMNVQAVQYDTAEQLAADIEKYVMLPLDSKEIPRDKVVVSGPMAILKDGLILADTPGIGAAYPQDSGITSEEMDARLLKYLKENVHEIFFCISATNAHAKKEELDFFAKLEDLCSSVIINKWEFGTDSDEEDLKRAQEQYSRAFPMRKLIFVEAKEAIEAIKNKNDEKLERSHFLDVSASISMLASKETRSLRAQQQIQTALHDISSLAESFARTPEIVWRKDSLARFKSTIEQYNHLTANALNPFLINPVNLVLPDSFRQ